MAIECVASPRIWKHTDDDVVGLVVPVGRPDAANDTEAQIFFARSPSADGDTYFVDAAVILMKIFHFLAIQFFSDLLY